MFEQIEKHRKIIEILETIEWYESRIRTRKRIADGSIIERAYRHEIEIFEKVIQRLKERYNKQLKNLSNETI
ncbi:MAG: hypothetical protein RLY43_2473 [Bacteroidota bacterium]|jgi:hypothetical protein